MIQKEVDGQPARVDVSRLPPETPVHVQRGTGPGVPTALDGAKDDLGPVFALTVRHTLRATALVDDVSFTAALEALREWKNHPAAAQWYVVHCAEGFVPGA